MAPAPASERDGDHGFTLVEVLVVILILAIVMALGFTSVGSARKTGQHQAALAAAHAYADGADAFAREHAGRYPKSIGDAQDWPNAKRGPTDPALGNKRYMLRIPENVQSDSVAIGSVSAKIPSITYEVLESGRAYRFVIHSPNKPSAKCALYGGVNVKDAAKDVRECSSR